MSDSKLNRRGQSDNGEAVLSLDTVAHPRSTITEIYSHYVNRVYRYILMNVGDTQVAQDLTSETFLAVIEHLHRFRGEGDLAVWILGIARHKISDYFRSHRNLLPLDAVTAVAGTDPLPEDLAERQWQVERVAGALRTLAPDRAAALTLYIFAELSIKEVSEVLGRSEAAVRMLIYRAVQDLKARLAADNR